MFAMLVRMVWVEGQFDDAGRKKKENHSSNVFEKGPELRTGIVS